MSEPPPDQDDFPQSFWPWFALGVLLFCWIAEATMCAVRRVFDPSERANPGKVVPIRACREWRRGKGAA